MAAPGFLDGGGLDWSYGGGIDAAPVTTFSEAGSSAGVLNFFQGLASTVSAGANAYLSFQKAGLDLAQQQAAIDIAKTQSAAQADIAKAQSRAAVAIAQRQATSAVNGWDGFGQTMSNLNARIAGLGGTDSVMLWLTIAGVGIAAFQLWGRK